MTDIPVTKNSVVDDLLQEKKLEYKHVMVILQEIKTLSFLKQKDVIKRLSDISDYSVSELKAQMREARAREKDKNKLIHGHVVKGDWPKEHGMDDEALRSEIMTLLIKGERGEATELMAIDLMGKEHIYTIRNDDKPQTYIYRDGIYVPDGKTYIQERCRDVMGDAFTTYLVHQVVAKIQADTYVDQEEFLGKKQKDFIAVENGILHLKTRKLYEFTPEMIFFNKVPVKFDPEIDCPHIKQFFSEITNRDEDMLILQEIFGYLLYDDHFIEKAFIFHGDGSNGKSKTIDLMKRLIGYENCTEIPLEDLEKDMFSMGELFNKKANLCGDLSSTALKHTGNFKKLVGRDLITAPRKYLTRVKFVNTAKMIFACNELPIVYEPSDAFWRRWVILDFPFKFLPDDELSAALENDPDNKWRYKKRDPHKIENISTDEEMTGMLNWALNGLKRLFEREDFTDSQTTKEIEEKWMARSDSCLSFTMFFVEEDYDSFVTKKDFRKYYSLYCKKNKLKMSTDARIKTILAKQLGVVDERITLDSGKRERVWSGIKLNNIDKLTPIKSNNKCNNSYESVQDIQGVQGFSPYAKMGNFGIGPIVRDRLDTLDTFCSGNQGETTICSMSSNNNDVLFSKSDRCVRAKKKKYKNIGPKTLDTLDTFCSGKRDKKNEIQKDKQTKNQKEAVFRVFKQYQQFNNNKSTSIDAIFNTVFKEWPRKLFDKIIEQLKEEGQIFESKPGEVRVL
jgi:putative DNA primase/helicase